MKYGVHTGEPVESILERKNNEFQNAGRVFWGYGGSLCHPINQIQPFAKRAQNATENIYLVMSKTNSGNNGEPRTSQKYSIDKENWKEMPKGIQVLGSKHAVVCDKIELCKFDLDLNLYEIGVGPSTGWILGDYIGNRVDKACAIKAIKKNPEKKIEISLIAKLLPPYAVFISY